MGGGPYSASAVWLDPAEQGRAFLIKLPSAVRFKTKQLANAESCFAAREIFRRNVVTRKVFFGKIDAAEFVVFVDVADDVGELEGEAKLFGKVEGAGIAETEDVRAGKTDGPGDAVAVFAQTVERGIKADGEHDVGSGRQRVALGFRQQEKDVVEIAVRGAGDAVEVLVGCGNRGHRRWRSIMRPRNRRESSRFAGL